ncbi:MAG: lipid-A-disaccharide synthase [Candidatus Abyssobacteria bacterium SURF_5]|uniref:Lipid-A-disaccharide synthase n=1 Tax=Abyssobacteria bacterium (strain SURF_5) TaxID=2093360 RepID=A0A3A4P2P0_ABYX5|nr:MAG: lipid-A-disaccharide synthase [Candidatus Abyssubacteria bacterium SURF_5]
MSNRRLFIVAGEASGDAHAARVIKALKRIDADLLVEGLGGEEMQRAGCRLRADFVSSAVMGFARVVKRLPFFRRVLVETKRYLRENRPDALVLVDYPGFNLRLAAAAKKLRIPVAYYISPQVWAWRPGRIHKIARCIDKMIVILPFEEKLYAEIDVDVTYVGHPLLDHISETALDDEFLRQFRSGGNHACIFGLMPGSREQEIRANLPVMIETADLLLKRIPNARFLVPCSSRANLELVKTLASGRALPVEVLLGKMHETASVSRCCIVASGTAALEVACFLTPLIVVYRTNFLAWMLAQKVLRVPHISLVNILAGSEVVPEMLQSRMRPDLLAELAIELSEDGERRRQMIQDLRGVRERLGAPGASDRAAQIIRELINRAESSRAPALTE